MGKTGIEWADYSWNPYSWSCTKVFPGCQNCYMMEMGKSILRIDLMENGKAEVWFNGILISGGDIQGIKGGDMDITSELYERPEIASFEITVNLGEASARAWKALELQYLIRYIMAQLTEEGMSQN